MEGGGEGGGEWELLKSGLCADTKRWKADMSTEIVGGEWVVKTVELDVVTQLFKRSESRGRKY